MKSGTSPRGKDQADKPAKTTRPQPSGDTLKKQGDKLGKAVKDTPRR